MVRKDEQQVCQHYISWSVSHELFMKKQVVLVFLMTYLHVVRKGCAYSDDYDTRKNSIRVKPMRQ